MKNQSKIKIKMDGGFLVYEKSEVNYLAKQK